MLLSLTELLQVFRNAGATRIWAKPLVNNDNSKQQIYLGGSFDVLKILPFGAVVADNSAKRPNFKASVSLKWINSASSFEPAQHTKLILYPDYPEVRLSGFLLGCRAAPSKFLQPVPRADRLPPGSWDGRVLFLGVTESGDVLAALSTNGSVASAEFDTKFRRDEMVQRVGVLCEIQMPGSIDTRQSVLNALTAIKQKGWIQSVRLQANGQPIPYNAKNGGGYTLEAMLGVTPNGRSLPDYLGWEIKAFNVGRITLMTPEPDAGYYGEHGTEAFLRRYGYRRPDDTLYFTGTHRVGQKHLQTHQTLTLPGYDPKGQKIIDVCGGIALIDDVGQQSAVWTFPDLIAHWGRKHANAAYVKYVKRNQAPIEYAYPGPALLGVGTEFTKYLQAMFDGLIVYDPGSKLTNSSRADSKVKARNQFRTTVGHLPSLYQKFETVPL